MAEVRTMARPYARAVFDIARGADALADWSQALSVVAQIVSNEDVARAMGSPSVTAEQMADSIVGIAGDALDAQGQHYVQLLASNDRLALAPAIAEQYEVLRAAAEQRVDVNVTSATEFTQQQKDALSASLEQRLSAHVTLTFEQDADLIGGAVIRAGDLVIDRSLRSQLARMQRTLTQ